MVIAGWREVIPQMPGPMTKFTVTVTRRPMKDKIRLGQVQKRVQRH